MCLCTFTMWWIYHVLQSFNFLENKPKKLLHDVTFLGLASLNLCSIPTWSSHAMSDCCYIRWLWHSVLRLLVTCEAITLNLFIFCYNGYHPLTMVLSTQRQWSNADGFPSALCSLLMFSIVTWNNLPCLYLSLNIFTVWLAYQHRVFGSLRKGGITVKASKC